MGFGTDLRVIKTVSSLLGTVGEELPITETLNEPCGHLLEDKGAVHLPDALGALYKVHVFGMAGLEFQQGDGLASIVPLHPHQVDGELPGVISGRALAIIQAYAWPGYLRIAPISRASNMRFRSRPIPRGRPQNQEARASCVLALSL